MIVSASKSCLLAVVCLSCECGASPVDYVNPFVGTGAEGHAFPGACWPMGMVQPSPDTGAEYACHCSGYDFRDRRLMGFTQTHLSGTGCCDLQDFLLLPLDREFAGGVSRPIALIDKQTETASPGYYAVRFESGIRAEVTCSRRVAYYRFAFPTGMSARVFIDTQAGPYAWWRKDRPEHRVVASESAVSDDGVFEGHNRVNCWLPSRDIWCRMEFSARPLKVVELKSNGRPGKRYVLEFDLAGRKSLEARVAVSAVDAEGCRINLASEPHVFDFDARHRECREAWDAVLSRVKAEGTIAQLRRFYTALYHVFIHPNLFGDADGRVRFSDSKRPGWSKVMRTKGHDVYTTFSLWDTYRAVHPLYTLLMPERVPDLVRSMLASCEAIGKLPNWQLAGGETYCMIGLPSVQVLADAAVKGIAGVPDGELIAAVERSLPQYRDEDAYDSVGYVATDSGLSCPVSRTLEFCMSDAAAAVLAERGGRMELSRLYRRRADYWKNLFDAKSGFMRGKDSSGKWREPFDPSRQSGVEGEIEATSFDYCEGGAWQWTWHVLHDPHALVNAFGGRERFAVQFQNLFADRVAVSARRRECTGMIGQFALGNEHDQHVPYLWQYVGRPDRTAEIVQELCERYYGDGPDGLCGDDDCGQMSAWYVFACLGFYPLNPVGGEYVLGMPQLPSLKMKVRAQAGGDGGKDLVITREDRGATSVSLNGKLITGGIITHSEITTGGELVFK